MNQRQIDIIKQEIIPKEKLENADLGIVTPYRNQTNALQSTFQGTSIKADTVDKFQGRENEVIILSTVDIKDFSKLDEQETKYASHPLTHLDFLIYNKLGKDPVLAIEVDGFEFHKQGTRQAERDKMKDKILEKYDFPLLRFRTNESNEKEKLTNKLNELQKATLNRANR